MKIPLDPSTTLMDIQRQFQLMFPLLSIRFSDKEHQFGEAILHGHWHDESLPFLSITKTRYLDYIEIEKWYKTGDVEQLLQKFFGVHPQVFRKQNDSWIQTAGTDEFTLEEQNEIAQKNIQDEMGSFWPKTDALL